MEKKVLTEEELQELQQLAHDFEDLKYELGTIEIQTIVLNSKKQELTEELNRIQQLEKELAKKLEEKYGEGSFSLETGEFTP